MNMRINKKLIISAVCLISAILLMFVFCCILHCWEDDYKMKICNAEEYSYISYKGVKYEPKQYTESILIIGLDKFEEDKKSGELLNNQQSDFVMLVVFDKMDYTINVLHLNRDTMVSIDILGKNSERIDTVYQQLALAHTYGTGGTDSCQNTVRTVSELLGDAPIEHYVAITMDGVKTINDILGGVPVEITEDMTMIDPEFIEGETVTLKGDQALKYVRARGGLEDSSNLSRMKRQKRYLESAYEVAEQLMETDNDLIMQIGKGVDQYVQSNTTINQLIYMMERFKNFEVKNFYTLEGENVKGEKYMEFYPDEDALKQTILNLYYTPID